MRTSPKLSHLECYWHIHQLMPEDSGRSGTSVQAWEGTPHRSSCVTAERPPARSLTQSSPPESHLFTGPWEVCRELAQHQHVAVTAAGLHCHCSWLGTLKTGLAMQSPHPLQSRSTLKAALSSRRTNANPSRDCLLNLVERIFMSVYFKF